VTDISSRARTVAGGLLATAALAALVVTGSVTPPSGATLLAVVLVLDRFVVVGDVVATGWFAAVGLGAVVLVFLIVIGRAAR